MNKYDVAFTNKELKVKFNFRVCALITYKDNVLLQKSAKDDYYTLIGGRINFLEESKEALIREIKEEIGLYLNNNDLILNSVVENFFVYNHTKYHELLFVYKINDLKELNNLKNIKTLDKDDVVNIWFKKSEIVNLDLRPRIIKNIINETEFKHYVLKEY